MTRRLSPLLLLAALGGLAGCAEPVALTDSADAALSAKVGAPTAGLAVNGADVTVGQTSAPTWTLAKSGAVNTAAATVTWQITATHGATLAHQLAVSGLLTLTNDGAAPAAIGNVVVNLQTKDAGSKWSTRSANVANATDGDAAITAKVVAHGSSEGLTVFTENAGSGKLLFTDAATNTSYELQPAALVAPGATVVLRFTATFDNAVLALPDGTEIRAEVLVSFGNSNGNATNSATSLDINGNGTIDPTEARVRTVPTRHGGSVPASTPGNVTVAITDTPGDITTTGTATWSNPVFQLGATSGTVSVSYNGGASGGTIANCAQLSGTSLKSCDTQTVVGGGTGCTVGCTWQNREFVTFTQGDWGDRQTVAFFTTTVFDQMYFPAGIVTVGSLFTMSFSSPTAVADYLPGIGSPNQLAATSFNPTSTGSGTFGGNVLALRLNVDFSTQTGGASSLGYGNLRLCNYTTSPNLNGMTVSQILDVANTLLGGVAAPPHTIAELNAVLTALNAAFYEGEPSTFANAHLRPGACTSTVGWQDGAVLTHQQNSWGTGAGSTLLGSRFNTVYASSFGTLEIGIPGSGGYSMVFSGFTAIGAYLPAFGATGPLASDLLNPTSTPSGSFGGEVTALRLNIDFADAGFLLGSSGLRFGDIRMCNGVAALPAGLHGKSIREFQAIVNTLLGGGSNGYQIATVAPITALLNGSFAGGVSTWAHAHLRAGACPGAGGPQGEFVTFTQADWGEAPTAGFFSTSNFGATYFPAGIVKVGSLYTLSLSSPTAVANYLPSSGPPSQLTATDFNPTSSASGIFGGNVLALTLNIDFSSLTGSTSPIGFGSLRLCNYTTSPNLNGMTVSQILGIANALLGGVASPPHTIAELNALTTALNASYSQGIPDAFALTHLRSGACPTSGWQQGEFVTFTQGDWGNAPTTAIFTTQSFGAMYFPTGLVVGSFYTMTFSSPTAVDNYLPALLAPNQLSSSLSNPTISSSGRFGGEVVALKLNIDFSSQTGGTSSLGYGNLRICNYSSNPNLNGLTVNQFLGIANTMLGALPAPPHTIAELSPVAALLNAAFYAGTPSSFAQAHLRSGVCP